ncbi:MAG: squalene/phytoene synthase family protein [Gemmatimonadota bacterium]|nr:squalene/phytoene synthase family protein [Gemmatimonadota bacterium]
MTQSEDEGDLPKTARAVSEAIASKDLNNLFRTSCLFRNRARYWAFCAYYSVMRVVDDRIDNLPSRAGLSPQARRAEHEVVSAWESAVARCYADEVAAQSTWEACQLTQARELLEAFTDSLEVVRPPEFLWSGFFRSMHWDLDHSRFRTWEEFLEYAEGASVAPTTVYLYVITSQLGASGGTVPEGFDIVRCGRHLGRFAYLGHILRDLAEDLMLGDSGLIYLPLDEMAAFGVTEAMLFSDLRRGRASDDTRLLVSELVTRARDHLAEGQLLLGPLKGKLEEDCDLVLALILATYERVLDKIQSCDFDVMGTRHRLTSPEKEALLVELAGRT